MIKKMKFINIMGPVTEFDRVVQNYFQKYDIQIENAMSELKTVHDIKPFADINPYEARLHKCEEITQQITEPKQKLQEDIKVRDAIKIVDKAETAVGQIQDQLKALETEKAAAKESLNKIEPFRALQFNISKILDFKYMKYRFGKFPKEYYTKFKKTVYDNTKAIFLDCYDDMEYVWGVYFATKSDADKVDVVFTSMHFDRIYIPDEYEGTTEEVCTTLQAKIKELDEDINRLTQKKRQLLDELAPRLFLAKERLTIYTNNFDVRKLAACTNRGEKLYFILCGWISEEDEVKLGKDLQNDRQITCVAEDEHTNIFSTPPTELKNPKIFKPFEMYIRMYGLPAYDEIDPTIFVALTYAFIFGVMFGDVGQGICLVIGGILLYRFKKLDLAAIIGTCGIFSTIFGFLFGSVFGFEDIIKPVWIRPLEKMAEVPFVGKLNYIFIVAIAFGMLIIIISMIMNIINSVKAKDMEKGLFDANGIAGLVFFGSAVSAIVLFMTGHALPGGIVLIVMFGLPLLAIALKEPIINKLRKRAEILPDGVGMYITQTFFELFELLLSYFSNTLSFVRIGAFAVSHAAMMQVVLMLAGADQGNANIVVLIIGNIFVCGMEGLIVGIQVLRLEFYEMFSRFYRGTGHAFRPFRAAGRES